VGRGCESLASRRWHEGMGKHEGHLTPHSMKTLKNGAGGMLARRERKSIPAEFVEEIGAAVG
jgi:hypothetical protein